jgi:hypothetical protein
MTTDETIELMARGYTREQIAALNAAREQHTADEPETKPETKSRGRRRQG